MAPLMIALFCLLATTQAAVIPDPASTAAKDAVDLSIVPAAAASSPTQDIASIVIPLTILAKDDDIKDVASDVKDKVADVVADAKDKVADVVDAVKDKVADIVDDAKDKTSAVVDIAETASAVVDTASDMVDDVQDAISAVTDDAAEAVTDMVENIQEAVSETTDDTNEQISEIIDEIADAKDDASDDTTDDVITDVETSDYDDIGDSDNADDIAEVDETVSQYGDDTKSDDKSSVVLDFVESLKRDLGLVTLDDDNSHAVSVEGKESAEDRTDDKDHESAESWDDDNDNHSFENDDNDDLFEALFPNYAFSADDDNSRDGDDDDHRKLNRYVAKMSKVRGYLDTLEGNFAHSKALQAGTCPLYPVQVDTDKVTITTQNGCKIVIRLKGAVVDRIESGHENLTDRKGLKRAVEVSYLDD